MSDRMDNPVVNLNEVSDSHDGLNNAKGKYGGWEGTAQRHQQQRERAGKVEVDWGGREKRLNLSSQTATTSSQSR